MSIKTFVSKNETTYDANTYIGTTGEMWINSNGTDVHVGDNTTPGGIIINGSGGGSTGDIGFTGTTMYAISTPANVVIRSNDNSTNFDFNFTMDGVLKMPNGQIGQSSNSDTFEIFADSNSSNLVAMSYGNKNSLSSYFYIQHDQLGGSQGDVAITSLKNFNNNGYVEWIYASTGETSMPGNVLVNGTVIDNSETARKAMQSVGIKQLVNESVTYTVSNVAPILYTGAIVINNNNDGHPNIYVPGQAMAGEQQLNFTIGAITQYTVFAYVTTPVGTAFSQPELMSVV